MAARSLVVTPALVTALTGDCVRYSLLRPARIAMFAVCAAVVLAAVVLLSVDPNGSGDLQEGPLLLVVCGLTVAVTTVVTAVTRIRRSIGAAFPAGSTVAMEVAADSITVQTARASGSTLLSTYDRFGLTPSAVLLRIEGARTYAVLPRELLTGDEVELVRARIASRSR